MIIFEAQIIMEISSYIRRHKFKISAEHSTHRLSIPLNCMSLIDNLYLIDSDIHKIYMKGLLFLAFRRFNSKDSFYVEASEDAEDFNSFVFQRISEKFNYDMAEDDYLDCDSIEESYSDSKKLPYASILTLSYYYIENFTKETDYENLKRYCSYIIDNWDNYNSLFTWFHDDLSKRLHICDIRYNIGIGSNASTESTQLKGSPDLIINNDTILIIKHDRKNKFTEYAKELHLYAQGLNPNIRYKLFVFNLHNYELIEIKYDRSFDISSLP